MRSARHVDTGNLAAAISHTHVYTQASPEQHHRWHHCQMRSGCCELTQFPQPLTQYGAHDNRQAVISCWQFWGKLRACIEWMSCMSSGMSRVSQRCPQRCRCLAHAWMATLYGVATSIWPENSVNLAQRPPCTAPRCTRRPSNFAHMRGLGSSVSSVSLTLQIRLKFRLVLCGSRTSPGVRQQQPASAGVHSLQRVR
jgi:hypothetical protein